MKSNIFRIAAGLLLVFLIISACSLLAPTPPPPSDQQALFTQAAQTVVAQFTQTAISAQKTPPASLPTNTTSLQQIFRW